MKRKWMKKCSCLPLLFNIIQPFFCSYSNYVKTSWKVFTSKRLEKYLSMFKILPHPLPLPPPPSFRMMIRNLVMQVTKIWRYWRYESFRKTNINQLLHAIYSHWKLQLPTSGIPYSPLCLSRLAFFYVLSCFCTTVESL